MRQGHYAAASPCALAFAYGGAMLDLVPPAIAAGGFVVAVVAAPGPDLDHPNHKGRMRPLAALVRGLARLAYLVRTADDKVREDVHRGPSHCVEAALLVGAVAAYVLSRSPLLEPYAWWWGASITVGWLSHVGADAMTPSGVPVSAIYSYLRHGEVWRRYSLGWFATDSAGERFLAVPALYAITGVSALAMLGVLGPVLGVLTGWSG